VRDPCFLGDVAHTRSVIPAPREHANRGVQDLPALVLHGD
jgi:hypothetical protein